MEWSNLTDIKCSVSGMERHIDTHTHQFVHKLYHHEGQKTWHVVEQYFRSGGFCPKPGAKMRAFVVKGCRYVRGSEWKCSSCGWSIKWGEEDTGQRGSRIVEKIEKHIAERETHGSCDGGRGQLLGQIMQELFL